MVVGLEHGGEEDVVLLGVVGVRLAGELAPHLLSDLLGLVVVLGLAPVRHRADHARILLDDVPLLEDAGPARGAQGAVGRGGVLVQQPLGQAVLVEQVAAR